MISGGVGCGTVILYPESRAISGITAFSTLDLVCFGISSLKSVSSCNGSSGWFLKSVRFCIFKSFSRIKSLASSSDSVSTGEFVNLLSVVLFLEQTGLPGGLVSWSLSRPMGNLNRFRCSFSFLRLS